MELKELKKELPFKWRVQSANQYGAKCVAYIDARDVQDLLDDVCGQAGWQSKYTEHKGNLFCSIGILDKHGTWVWKEDCGTESNIEKAKGESSDAFKRAAVMWGVGRFLYKMELVQLDAVQHNGKWLPSFNGVKLYGDKVTEACNYKINNKK